MCTLDSLGDVGIKMDILIPPSDPLVIESCAEETVRLFRDVVQILSQYSDETTSSFEEECAEVLTFATAPEKDFPGIVNANATVLWTISSVVERLFEQGRGVLLDALTERLADASREGSRCSWV